MNQNCACIQNIKLIITKDKISWVINSFFAYKLHGSHGIAQAAMNGYDMVFKDLL